MDMNKPYLLHPHHVAQHVRIVMGLKLLPFISTTQETQWRGECRLSINDSQPKVRWLPNDRLKRMTECRAPILHIPQWFIELFGGVGLVASEKRHKRLIELKNKYILLWSRGELFHVKQQAQVTDSKEKREGRVNPRSDLR